MLSCERAQLGFEQWICWSTKSFAIVSVNYSQSILNPAVDIHVKNKEYLISVTSITSLFSICCAFFLDNVPLSLRPQISVFISTISAKVDVLTHAKQIISICYNTVQYLHVNNHAPI